MIPAMSDDFYKALARIPEKEIPEVRSAIREVLQQVLSEGVRPAQLVQKREQAIQMLEKSYPRGKARDAAAELLRTLIVPNVVVDKALTDALRETARESVKPVIIQKGDVIVAAGEVVTEEKIRELRELGLIRHHLNFRFYTGLILFLLIWLALLYVCVQRFHPEIHADNGKVLMMAAVFILNLLAMKVVSLGQDLEWSTVGYCAPFAFGPMLLALLLDTRLAIWFGVLFSLAAGIFFNGEGPLLFDYRYGLVALVSGTAGALALAGVRNRPSIFRAGLFASFAATMAVVALHLLVPAEGDLRLFLQSVGFALLSGVISAVLTIGFLSLFETVFDILSPLRLLELSNPNHPLLRKLLTETPGTYHHCVMVGNLSEAAAEAIGANGLLCRVGAYYHDIGKTKRPRLFHREPESDGEPARLDRSEAEPVDHYRPRARRRGDDEGAQHSEADPRHRGTASRHDAAEIFLPQGGEAGGGGGSRAGLHGGGFPLSRTESAIKEAAIVGIADCVEAAVRSLRNPTIEQIESMIHKIIGSRLEDNQFNECDLTLKELEVIGRSMCETLQGIFHARIEYPEEVSGKGKDVKNGVVG